MSERPWEWQQIPLLTNNGLGQGVHGEVKMTVKLKFPAPYFGGKSKVAALVWQRLGDVDNFIEGFAGSAAVLLARPHPPRVETVNDPNADFANAWRATDPESGQPAAVADHVCEILNDLDPYLVNVWRSIQADPEGTAQYADQPVNEATMHAIHRYLVLGDDAAEFRQKVRTDPDFFDVKRAGRWLFGACCWIGGGWCVDPEHGTVNGPAGGSGERMPNVNHQGKGINRIVPADGVHAKGDGLSQKKPHLTAHGHGNSLGDGVHANGPSGSHRPQLADAFSRGRGVHGNDAADHYLSQQVPHLGQGSGEGPGNGAGKDVHANASAGTCASRRAWLVDWFSRLRDRLRTVRVCCGHWLRVCDSESVTTRLGTTGLFLDAPYKTHLSDGTSNRSDGLYATDGDDVNALVDEVIAYCLERGNNPKMRIVACAYEGEGYEVLLEKGWTVEAWASQGGYANRNKKNKNRNRERIFFSPHCIPAAQKNLFDGLE